MDWDIQKQAMVREMERLSDKGFLGMGVVFPSG